jgi:hypothetical protein
MPELEPPMQYITMQRACEISGISRVTLGNQARARRGNPPRLRTVKLGHTLVTTRVWLHEYLTSREETNKQAAPLPAGYVPPE